MGVVVRRLKLRSEAGGLALLAIALAFNVFFLRGEARVSAVPLNDEVFHAVASQRLAEAIAGGEPFLDSWVPNWGLGFPVWRSYQPLPHLVAAAAVSSASPGGETRAFALLATIITGLLPLALYAGARIFGLSATASGLASLLCLLPSGAGEFGRYGLSYGASVWLGSGLYTQQFALLLLPIALGVARHALDSGRWRFAAGAALALTVLSHIVFGYVGALAVVVLALVGSPEGRASRIARVAWIAAGAFLLTAWFTIPLFLSRAEINHSRFEPGYKWDSFGSRTILTALFDGTLLDFGRLPVLTLLLGLAVVGEFLLRRDDIGRRLLTLTLVLFGLFLGRDTWGHLLLLLGVPADLHLHRLQAAFEISACLLAAWFADVSIRELRRLRPPLHVVAALLLGAGVLVALSERADYLRRNTQIGEASLGAYRAEEADVRAAMADVRRLVEARPGRVSAGRAADWGRDFKVGEVPVYSLLTLERFDQASFLFHSLSRAGDFVLTRDEENAAHDDLFGIRAVVAPADRPAPAHLRQVGRHGRFAVYEASRDGYFGLGDTFATYTGPPSTTYEPSAAWLSTPLPGAGLFVALGPGPGGLPSVGRWQPFPPAPPELETPRGEIVSVSASPGRWKAGVRLTRPCQVIFKSTFFPDLAFTVDGVAVPSIRVTPGFPAAPVPAGDHVVEVVYRPSQAKPVLFVAGFAAFALMAIVAKRQGLEFLDARARSVVARALDVISRHLPASAIPLIALLLLSCRALLRGFLVNGHDATAYPPRLVEFFRAVADGHIPPVWAADLGNGFGQPLFGFASPLVLVAALPFRILGCRLADSLQFGLVILVAVGALAVYRLARDLPVSPLAALGATACWLFAPYFHTDLFVRAAFAEAAALAVAPVAVLALWRVLGPRPSAAGLAMAAAAIAAVVLGHNAVALLLMPALALLVLFESIGPPLRFAPALKGGGAIAAGLALSAFFWAPALAENGWVKTYLLLSDPSQSWTIHFPTLGQLLYSPWGFGYSLPGPDDGMSFMVGPLLLLGGAVGLWAAIRRGPGRARTLAFASAAASLIGIFVVSPLSAFVWQRVPLLQYFVFPWRALALPTVFLPLLAAFALDAVPRRAALATIAAVVLLGLPHTEPQGYLRYDEEFYEPERIAANGVHTSTLEEYEPKWVGQRPPHAAAPLSMLSGIEVLERLEKTARRAYVVRVAERGTVEAATFWFPGWRVEVDGLPVPTGIVPVRGTISFSVPAGVHRISLAFERTPVRRATLLVSLAAVVALLAAAVVLRRRRAPTGSIPSREAPPGENPQPDVAHLIPRVSAIPGTRPPRDDASGRLAVSGDRWAGPAFLVVFVVSMAFHLHFARGVTYYTRADEGSYFSYAKAVSTAGIRILPVLVANYIRDGSGMFPPPTRVGWILPSALALKLGGGGDPFPIGVLSTMFLGGTVVAVFAFLRVHLRPRTALIAASLVAFSPLLGGMARRVLLDSAVAFLTVATAFCFYQALKTRAARWSVAYGVFLSWLLVTKEISLVILLFLAGYAAWWKLRADRHVDLRPLATATALAGVASLAVYLALCGNLAAVATLARMLFGSPATNPYALAYNSGPWFRYFVDLASVSPAALVLALGFSFHYLVSRKGKAGNVEGFLIAFLVGLLAVHSVTIKNVRYVLAAEVPLRALAACAVASVLDAWPRRRVALGVAILVLVAVACDVVLFHRIFIAGSVYDPVTDGVLRALEMLPR